MHPNQSHRDYLTLSQLNSDVIRVEGTPRRGLLRQWLKGTLRRWQRRKMIAALNAMDERLLRDIGIFPGDIPRVVDGLSDRETRSAPHLPVADQAGESGRIRHASF